jgi:hypothetical protein
MRRRRIQGRVSLRLGPARTSYHEGALPTYRDVCERRNDSLTDRRWSLDAGMLQFS